MNTHALRASLLLMTFGIMFPQFAAGDDGAMMAEGYAADELTHIEDGYGHGPDGYGVSSGVPHPEFAHHRYLQSRTAGHAEYTHRWNRYHAAQSPWHGNYYNAQWGRPLALVVPPTADSQVSWGWGVGATNVTPIYHQFGRGNPATYPQGSWNRFRPTPYWPSHTDQFGVYYVRGPW